MNMYKIRLKILSPTATPWQSDTIFGHICWQVAFGNWEQNIKEFLEPFLEGKPPFILSDGFPDGLLPRPIHSKSMQSLRLESIDQYAVVKRLNKSKYLSVDDFMNICQGKPLAAEPKSEVWGKMEILHASIDRNTGTTSGVGELYQTEVIYLEDESYNNIINIYLLCEPDWKEKTLDLLVKVSASGYGKDKSVGCGRFKIIDIKGGNELLAVDNPNGFTTLSSYIPVKGDPGKGRWKIRTKRGKLGEGAGGENPFKRPLIQFEPGAVFQADSPRTWYGRMVSGIAPGMPEAVQCGYTIAVPMKLDHADPLFD